MSSTLYRKHVAAVFALMFFMVFVFVTTAIIIGGW